MTSTDAIVSRSWVVAFCGPRDFYQVPLALHEGGALDRLVTDFYAPALGSAERSKLGRFRHRRVDGLPFLRAQPTLSVVRQRWRLRGSAARSAVEVWRDIDATISRAAASRARSSGANLLLYKGYAREAFMARGLEGRAKGLFVYHPHGGFVRDLLTADAEAYPEIQQSFDIHCAEIELQDSGRLDEELALSDFVICASEFTATSLPAELLAGRTAKIVPYGVFRAAKASRGPAQKVCKFLFVGQGVQRKGIHHLLHAWNAAGLKDAELVIVASSMDPGVLRLVSQSVTVLGRQSRDRLDELFQQADVFVMPSLVEGFGLVYLEALAAGCYTIGTTNTGLPDLCLPRWASVVIDAGDIDALSSELVAANDRFVVGDIPHAEIAALTDSRSWEAFRHRIRDICRDELERPAPA